VDHRAQVLVAMKTAPFYSVLLFAIGAVFIATPVHAATLIAQQDDQSDTSQSFAAINVGSMWVKATSTTGFSNLYLTSFVFKYINTFNVDTIVNTSPIFSLQYFPTTACSGAHATYNSGNGPPYPTFPADGDTSSVKTVTVDLTRYAFPAATSGVQCIILVTGSNTFKGNGNKLASKSGVSYYLLYGNNGIDWSAITFPVIFDPTAAGIAASSTLWGAYASSSALTASCATGNVFGDAICSAFQYLFVPNPNVLNQWSQLPQTIEGRFPFSWVASTTDIFSGFTASSTDNFIDVRYDFAGSQMSTSSVLALPNILPSLTVFATSTIEAYLSPATWSLIQSLIATALWLAFGLDVFYTVRNSMHRV